MKKVLCILMLLCGSAWAQPHTVTISFTPSPSPNITIYRLYRSTTSGGPYVLVAQEQGATVISDINAQPATTYYYVATAFDKSTSEESVYSTELTVTTQPDPQPPTGLTGTSN